MLGTIVNAAAILAGTLLGLAAGRWFSDSRLIKGCSEVIMQGIGLSVMIIGISNSLKSDNMLLVIISLVIGGIIGQAVGIERRLDSLGSKVQKRLEGTGSAVSEGFVTASLIFCVGSMAIVGSIDAGIKGDYLTLYAKSVLDGVTAMVLSSTLGIGVALSALSVLLYQGAITLLAGLLYPLMANAAVVNDMSAVGGILILGIGISILGIKKLNIGNLLPAVFIPPLYYTLAGLIADLLG